MAGGPNICQNRFRAASFSSLLIAASQKTNEIHSQASEQSDHLNPAIIEGVQAASLRRNPGLRPNAHLSALAGIE
jgi:hypothetical protein